MLPIHPPYSSTHNHPFSSEGFIRAFDLILEVSALVSKEMYNRNRFKQNENQKWGPRNARDRSWLTRCSFSENAKCKRWYVYPPTILNLAFFLCYQRMLIRIWYGFWLGVSARRDMYRAITHWLSDAWPLRVFEKYQFWCEPVFVIRHNPVPAYLAYLAYPSGKNSVQLISQ